MEKLYFEAKDEQTKDMFLKQLYEYNNSYHKDTDDVSEDIARVL
jgi:hypothetical protein